MNKFVYFMVVGLAFTALQVATVEADPVLTIGDPACATVPPAAGCPPGSPGFMDPPMCGDEPCPPPGDHSEIDTSHCDQFEGAPKAACIAAAESGSPDGDACAARETPALVAACVREKESHPAP